MESNDNDRESPRSPGARTPEGVTGYQAAGGGVAVGLGAIPPLQSTSSSKPVDEEYGYNNEKSNENVPLLGAGGPRGRTLPRKQCIWNVVMAGALIATIVLIVLLVVLSSTAGNNDDGGDMNSTTVTALEGVNMPFRMLQATGDGNNATDTTGGGGGGTAPGSDFAEEPGPAPAPAPVVPNPAVPASAHNGTRNTTSSTPAPPVTNVTTTLAPTPTTTPEPPLDTTIQVTVDQGLLQGVRLNSSTGQEYLAFLGVPYAQPPIGNLRFKAPVEAEVWNGTYNATDYKSGCIGIWHGLGVNFTEDCLYLNVYSPKNSSELGTGGGRRGGGGGGGGRRGQQNQMPVIVYLTGDGDGGSSRTKAIVDHFMEQNVTFVTLNYRVGILGTLNLNTSTAAGNQGLKDQKMALTWVKDNIGVFGGNRRKVLLFGEEGTGSAHVTAHLLSPSNDGSFKRAVVNSGSVLQQGYFTPLSEALSQAATIGSNLNCSTNDITVAVTDQYARCLLNKTVDEILTAAAGVGYNVRLTIDAAASDENGDGENEGDDDGAFFPDTPAQLLQAGGSGQKIPIIVGTSSNSSIVTGQPKWRVNVIENAQGNSTQLITALDDLTSFIMLPERNTNETNRRILNQIQDFYFNQTSNSVDNSTNATVAADVSTGTGNETRTVDLGNPAVLTNVTNLYADRMLNHPAVAVAHELYLVNNGTGTGTGGGGRGGGGTFGNLFNRGGGNGVYLYHQNTTGAAIAVGAEAEGLFSSIMMQFWTSFADTGIPSAIDSTSGQNITWTSINNQTKPYQALWINYGLTSTPSNGTTNGTATTATNSSTVTDTNSSSYSFQMGDFFGERMQVWDSFNLTEIYQ